MSNTTCPLIRIYGSSLRTAHLERFRQMAPARVLYTGTRQDYDQNLVDPSLAPERLSRLGVLQVLLRDSHCVVEVNEPAMSDRWGFLLAQLAAIRIAGTRRSRRSFVVAYCIDNADPSERFGARLRLPKPLRKFVARVMMSMLVAGTDRLAFGTTASYELYRSLVPLRLLRTRSRLFEALPAPCGCLDGTEAQRGQRVLFVGGFVPRKGIRQLLGAWRGVHESHPAATLELIGQGPLASEVQRWSANWPTVQLRIDPPRAEIHAALRRAAVVVLLSQPETAWREQVGLPILEGLAHGCEVVATSETGLAPWLRAHGHAVVEPTASAAEISREIGLALERARSRRGSLADLPAEDQRIAADAWLMSAR